MICFFIYVFDEEATEVQAAIDRLNDVYPDCQVLVGYDGVPSLDVRGAENIELSRAKVPALGGLWTHRYLALALARTRCRYIMRVDSDTEVIRRANIAYEDGIFGQYRNIGSAQRPHWVIHGAALGFTRKAAETIVANGWMLAPRFVNSAFKTIDDVMLVSMAHERGIPIYGREDFACGPLAYKNANPAFRHR